MSFIHWIAVTLSSFVVFGVFYVYYNRIIIYCIESNHNTNENPSLQII